MAENIEKEGKIKARLHQTQFQVNSIIAGIVGVGGYDEEEGLYYPFPPEILHLVEQIQPGEIKDLDGSVTVSAGTTTASKEIDADEGQVFYITKIAVGGTPPSGTYTIKVDGTPVVNARSLSAETLDIVSLNGGKPIRGKKIEVIVELSSAPTADTTISITISAVQKKDITQ